MTNGSRMGDESKAILRHLFTNALILYYHIIHQTKDSNYVGPGVNQQEQKKIFSFLEGRT